MAARLRADDRVLALSIPHVDTIAALGRILSAGVLVGIGNREDVDEARRVLSDFDNVMLIERDQDRIPWRDGYFSKILATGDLSPALEAECLRVLAADGEIVRSLNPSG